MDRGLEVRTVPVTRGNDERGAVLVVSMVVLVSLLALGGLSMVATRDGVRSAGHERFRAVSLYAAEAGVAAVMQQIRDGTATTTLLRANHENRAADERELTIHGTGAKPDDQDNVFSEDVKAWYEVTLRNNGDDSGFDIDPDLDTDTDGRLIVRSVGHGPGNTSVIIEVEVAQNAATGGTGGVACEQYSQEGENSKGTGYDQCITTIDGTAVQTLDMSNL